MNKEKAKAKRKEKDISAVKIKKKKKLIEMEMYYVILQTVDANSRAQKRDIHYRN